LLQDCWKKKKNLKMMFVNNVDNAWRAMSSTLWSWEVMSEDFDKGLWNIYKEVRLLHEAVCSNCRLQHVSEKVPLIETIFGTGVLHYSSTWYSYEGANCIQGVLDFHL
jgi:hypothetical protein